MIDENLVIGFDGLSGVGKTSTARHLCQNNDNFISIELGDLCRIITPFWIDLKETHSLDYIIDFIKKLKINYCINDNHSVDFKVDISVPNIQRSKTYVRNETYNMVQIKEINQKINGELFRIIDELKNKYTVIVVGRELNLIYPNMDYHFYFKADEDDRISRIVKRDGVSEDDAKQRKIEESLHNFSTDVITINTSRLNMEEVSFMVENILKFRKCKATKIKVQFMGAQSTGKTTISKLCAETFNGIHLKETLREYMENNGMNALDFYSFDHDKWRELINVQLQYEKEMREKANKFIFSDNVALLYAIDFNLLGVSELNALVEEQLNAASVIFVCDNDIPYVEDGLRPKNTGSNIDECQHKLINYLIEKNIPFFILNGSVEERLKTVEQIIDKF